MNLCYNFPMDKEPTTQRDFGISFALSVVFSIVPSALLLQFVARIPGLNFVAMIINLLFLFWLPSNFFLFLFSSILFLITNSVCLIFFRKKENVKRGLIVGYAFVLIILTVNGVETFFSYQKFDQAQKNDEIITQVSKTGAATMCDNVSKSGYNEYSDRIACYETAAVTAEDLSICDKIIPIQQLGEPYVGECRDAVYVAQAVTRKDPSLCQNMSWSFDKDDCLQDVQWAQQSR